MWNYGPPLHVKHVQRTTSCAVFEATHQYHFETWPRVMLLYLVPIDEKATPAQEMEIFLGALVGPAARSALYENG